MEEGWKEKYGDIDPYEDDDKPAPSEWDDEVPQEYDGETYTERPFDSNDRQYNPWAGSQSYTPGRCNAVLTNYQERYGEPRYCSSLPTKYFKDCEDSDFCRQHTQREPFMESARELMKHGLFSQSFVHYFDKAEPVQKIVILGLYESLCEESRYDFEPEEKPIGIDFSKSEYDVERLGIEVDEDGEMVVAFPEPQAHEARALALMEAAVDEVKMLSANGELLVEDMRTESTEFVASNDQGMITDKEKTVKEHYLNLPYSRLIKDQKENLKRGGVDIEGTENEEIETVTRQYADDLPTKDEVKYGETFQNEDSAELVLTSKDELEKEIDE